MLPLLAACAGFAAVWLDALSLKLGPPTQIGAKPEADPQRRPAGTA